MMHLQNGDSMSLRFLLGINGLMETESGRNWEEITLWFQQQNQFWVKKKLPQLKKLFCSDGWPRGQRSKLLKRLLHKWKFKVQSSKFKVQNVRLGRVAAILPVHQMGIPCDIARILAIAKECDLPVVEDAACAIESEISLDAYSAKEVKSYIMLLRGTVTENNLSIISKGYVI